jgi:hypothetical protein
VESPEYVAVIACVPVIVKVGASVATPAAFTVAVPSTPCEEETKVTVPVGTVVLDADPDATVAVSVTVPPVVTVLAPAVIVVVEATVPLVAADVGTAALLLVR